MVITPQSNFANAVAPFNPQGRTPVGQEVVDDIPTTFNPVEQSSQLARRENQRQPDERANNQGEQARLAEGFARQEEGAQDPNTAADSQEQAAKEVQAKQQIEDQKVIAELSARDREVRAHEAAHAAVGGQYAGAPSYTFQKGPDGVSYAVGGEVSISTSAIANDPEATIAKAQQIKAAANAPADPSPQDRQVAAQAAQLEQQARTDLVEIQAAERTEQQERTELERELQEQEDARRQAAEDAAAQRQRDTDNAATDSAIDAERAAIDADASRRNIDLSQRLIDIGVDVPDIEPAGTFLDLTA